MKKVVFIEGLKCPKCSKHVDNALSHLVGVSKVITEHTSGKSVVICNNDVSDKMIEDAVNEAGYKFISVTDIQEDESLLGKIKSFMGL